jgi:spermidine synthase
MKLLTLSHQGQLRYLYHHDFTLTVMENHHYRWLMLNDIVQSVMLKRKPWRLTLPHHHIMMLPLAFFQPKKIIEFGLGGGNFARFLLALVAENSSDVSLDFVEKSQQIIDCFHEFFNPSAMKLPCCCADASDFITTHNESQQYDWCIYDVFRLTTTGGVDPAVLTDCEYLLKHIREQSVLSINIPLITNAELSLLCRTITQHLSAKHKAVIFTVPHYKNVIIHIVPRYFNRQHSSWLKPHQFKRYRQLWQYSKTID